jgi:hypothetical protein
VVALVAGIAMSVALVVAATVMSLVPMARCHLLLIMHITRPLAASGRKAHSSMVTTDTEILLLSSELERCLSFRCRQDLFLAETISAVLYCTCGHDRSSARQSMYRSYFLAPEIDTLNSGSRLLTLFVARHVNRKGVIVYIVVKYLGSKCKGSILIYFTQATFRGPCPLPAAAESRSAVNFLAPGNFTYERH